MIRRQMPASYSLAF